MKSITFQITEQDVEQYAALSGDFNPIHLDLETAQNQGFPNKIAHYECHSDAPEFVESQ